MKVFVYGNTLNIGFDFASQLRLQGINAELFLDNNSSSAQDFPWWNNKNLSCDNLPDWVHYYKVYPFFLFPNKETKKMIQDFKNCDVAIVSGWGPILAMKAKVPFIFISVGSDLNSLDTLSEFKSILFSSSSLKTKFRKFIKLITFVPLQKKAISKFSNRLIIGKGYQENAYIRKFNLEKKTVLLLHPKDIKNYQPPIDENLLARYKKFDLVFFMISRHTWQSVWNDLKGNDKFIRAYSRFVNESKPNCLLITVKKGNDVDKSKELITKLDIENYVEWVDEMPKYILKKYQSLPNVVIVDDFWHDEWVKRYPLDLTPKVGFGFGSIESLASKSLLLTAFSDDKFYANTKPPILYAFSEDEIYKRLVEIYNMTLEERNKMKEAGYEFVMKWHEQSNVIYKHINILKEVFSESKKDRI